MEATQRDMLRVDVANAIAIRERWKANKTRDGALRLIQEAWWCAQEIKANHAYAEDYEVGFVMYQYRMLVGNIYHMEMAIGVPKYVLHEWRKVYCGVK